jgi:proline iminopeptidase
MEHSRRDFVRDATVLAPEGAASGASGCADTTPPQAPAPPPDGVATGGSRLVPVVGGKYKVWTKKLGSGPIRRTLISAPRANLAAASCATGKSTNRVYATP